MLDCRRVPCLSKRIIRRIIRTVPKYILWYDYDDDMIFFFTKEEDILCYRAKLAIAIHFEQKEIEIWMTTQFVCNRMFSVVTFWHKFILTLAEYNLNHRYRWNLRMMPRWHYDDNGQPFRSIFSHQYELYWPSFREFINIFIFVYFVWDFLYTSYLPLTKLP